MRLKALVLGGAAALPLSFVPPARAQPTPPVAEGTEQGTAAAGHSVHGRAFDEGPRQQAYLMAGMPKIDFPISCKAKDAQAFFNQGIGQMHGFWYFEAERSFRQVALLDPQCPMAYFGMALANAYNEPRALVFLRKAVALRDRADAREKMWLDALAGYYKDALAAPPSAAEKAAASGKPAEAAKEAKGDAKPAAKPDWAQRRKEWIRGLEALIETYDDVEAKAFLVLAMWDNSSNFTWWDRGAPREPIPSVRAVEALAKEVLAKNPMHPLHHYLIHLWDGEFARRAVPSAARSGQSSPGIAHMWHMAAHTFTKVQRYQDAVFQQEASARVDHAYMMRDFVSPDQIHNYGHNNDWLVKNYAMVGRVRDALALAKNLVEIPQHPVWNSLVKPSEKGLAFATAQEKRENSAHFGRQRLYEVTVRFELWDDLIALSTTPHLAPIDDALDTARRARALAIAYHMKGRRADADRMTAELEAALRRLKEERLTAVEEAEKKGRAEKQPDDQLAKAIGDALKKQADAIKQTEAGLAEVKTLRALVATRKPDPKLLEAITALPKDRQAILFFHAGERDKGLKLAQEAAESAKGEVFPLANLADLAWRAGKKAEAQEAFGKLRAISATLDLELPIVRRLAPVAASVKAPSDWRQPHKEAPDVAGTRPALATLGPRFWTPPRAPTWTLPDAQGRAISLAQYKGKPVIVIFYLGYGCLHCLEQLTLFAPAAKKFQDAGISLVAVSTDSVQGLKQTLTLTKPRSALPFPLVSDERLEVFKKYRAFDGFEKIPLHGTFLVDGDGLVRWHDISYEPFKEVDFLLGEAKRLLKFKPAKPEPGPSKAPNATTPVAHR
jgi:peroxiredoxin